MSIIHKKKKIEKRKKEKKKNKLKSKQTRTLITQTNGKTDRKEEKQICKQSR